MRQSFRKLMVSVSAILLLIVGVFFVGRFVIGSATSSAMRKPEPAVKEIAGYRGWTKPNAQPLLMAMRTALLCAPARPASAAINVEGPTSPHHERFLANVSNSILISISG